MSGSNAYEEIRKAAVALIEERRIDPVADRSRARSVVAETVNDYQRRAHLGHTRALRDPAEMTDRVLGSIADYGPLTELLSRPDIEEVFIEGSQVSFIDSSGILKALTVPTTEHENRQVVDRLLGATDRHLDTSSPIVQARVLDDTARLTAVVSPIADKLSVTIRRYALRKETLSSLVELGSLTPSAAGFLWSVMQTNLSALVSGPPGAGKTSLLSAMIAATPATHCIRCCEEVRELHVPIVHGSYYEARPPSLDGSGEISLRDLVKVVLAMRPDRIIVGEVRGSEAFELTRAVNAGCGMCCTVHANSARDALNALVNAALMAGENVAEPIVRRVFAASIDFVVHLDRDSSAATATGGLRRQVMEILSVVPSMTDDFSTEPLFNREALGKPLEWTGTMPPDQATRVIEASLPEGMTLRSVLEGRVSPL
ncbi:MAG: ATPase, T2SS/T4P/T4SS family [Acidimicrobiia bacterium]|nr:ATPase, T2SS/T4P/T4SS family [Acidimicrobiia bacterium]